MSNVKHRIWIGHKEDAPIDGLAEATPQEYPFTFDSMEVTFDSLIRTFDETA